MPKTTNLGLELTTDSETTFIEWRKAINGEGDGSSENPKSNMQLIDEAIGNIKTALDTILGV